MRNVSQVLGQRPPGALLRSWTLFVLSAWSALACLAFIIHSLDRHSRRSDRLLSISWADEHNSAFDVPLHEAAHGAPAGSKFERFKKLSTRQWKITCPEWVQQYGAMHQGSIRSKGSSKRVKFMMHSCGERSYRYCAGIGDRIRAMMETVRGRRRGGGKKERRAVRLRGRR